MAKAGSGVAAAPPKTLGMLLGEFLTQHAEEKLAAKTCERYREQAGYLSAELLAMPIAEVSPLHLNREWARLLKSGGHTRKTRTPLPLSAKSVRHIAGVVSRAFGRAIQWGWFPPIPFPTASRRCRRSILGWLCYHPSRIT